MKNQYLCMIVRFGEMINSKPVIELRNVSVFQPSRPGSANPRHRGDMVVSGVDLTVYESEMVYLIGRVGSGKSSLIKILYAEIPLWEGEGAIVGFDLKRLRKADISRLRRSIGVVFQDYQLLTDRNVFNNLYYVMKAIGWNNDAEMRRRIEQVLKIVDLETKHHKMPFELSGGEQQRLAIARALVNNPSVILADEPTGNLDPAAAEEIMDVFKRIVNTRTSIVMATHNIANIEQYPARTIRFNKGKAIEIDIKKLLGMDC